MKNFPLVFLLVFPLGTFLAAEEAPPAGGVQESSPAETATLLPPDAKPDAAARESGTVILKIDAETLPKALDIPKAADSPLLSEDQILTTQTLLVKGEGLLREMDNYFRAHQIHFFQLFLGIIVTSIFVWLFRMFMRRFLYKMIFLKTPWKLDERVYDAVAPPATCFLWTCGVFLSAMPLLQGQWMERIFMATLFALLFWGLYRFVDVLDGLVHEFLQKSDKQVDRLVSDFVRKMLRSLLVAIALFFIGQTVLGLNITALLAAAGIAGLAVALAVKDSLANFFCSLQMIFDHSFKIGDRIRTNGVDGYVESVDFRCTRIRSLDGHLFIVPNSLMSANLIENISDRPKIKYVFNLALTYDTSPEKIRRAKEILHHLTDNPGRYVQGEKKPLIVFSEFQDWALNLNIILWFNTTDWGISQIWQSDLNLEILDEFNKEHIEFAFPTQTIVAQNRGNET